MSEWTYQSWMDALRDVQKRAAGDAAFRSLAGRDARAALREVSGRDVPEAFRIRFAEPGEEMVIPLPAAASGSDELSSAELEAVSGGAPIITFAGCAEVFDTTPRICR